MDVSAVKAKNIIDAAASAKSNKSTGEQLAGNFSAVVAERMKMSGQSVVGSGQTGLISALTDKTSAQAAAKPEQRASQAAPREEHQPRERTQAPSRDVDDYAPQAEAKDTAPRENIPQDNARSDAASDSSDRGASSDQQSQSDNNDSDTSKDGSQDAETSQAGDGDDAVDTADGVADQSTTGQSQDVLATVVDVIQKTVSTGAEGGSKQTAVTGVDKTLTGAASQQANANAGQAGDDLSDLDMAGENATKKNASDTGAKQAQTNSGVKTDGNHALNQDVTVKQLQAADIASKIGPNQKLDVNVTVTKQAEQLVSQPTANLGTQAAVANDGDSLTQTASQAAAKGPVQGQQAATLNLGNQANQQGQEGQQQAQQNMQAAIAEAAKNGAATDTKSQAVQAANNNATSGAIKIGGAEGATNAQGVTQTNTPQQQLATTPQKATQNPQAQYRAQVNEQVNVQISKAIANGMDKISIQLKPAHLGRIDIQMEIASDGRVTAVVTADNKDTLDLLKQDSRELERAMREAGLQMNSGDLSFNLRENANQGQDGTKTAGSNRLSNEPTLDELLEANAGRPNIISDDRIDITA
ncbi:MAG: flagellar hook-length control protein FliK [Magnetovibrio sp.]|nr:flagellar hook-length control protein FliK [Magnetovibrio sp.]